MSLFVIGDLHLSFGTDKPMDIFGGWSNHVERLEENWRAVVTDSDTVVLAGDLSWGTGLEQALPDLLFIDALPGKKLVLKGNHDYWWETKTKMERFFAEHDITTLSIIHNNAYRVGDIAVAGTRGWFYDAKDAHDGKVIAREQGRLRTSIKEAEKLGGEVVAFLHYPPVFAGRECPEMMSVLEECGIKRCYYGHLHGRKNHQSAVTGLYKGIDFSLISCDYTSFKPIVVGSQQLDLKPDT